MLEHSTLASRAERTSGVSLAPHTGDCRSHLLSVAGIAVAGRSHPGGDNPAQQNVHRHQSSSRSRDRLFRRLWAAPDQVERTTDSHAVVLGETPVGVL